MASTAGSSKTARPPPTQVLQGQPRIVRSTSIQQGADALFSVFERDKARTIAHLEAALRVATAPPAPHSASTSALGRMLEAAEALIALQPSIDDPARDPLGALRAPLADARRELHTILSMPHTTPTNPPPTAPHPAPTPLDQATADGLIMERTRRALAEARVRQLEAELERLRSQLETINGAQPGSATVGAAVVPEGGAMDVDTAVQSWPHTQ